MADRDGRETPLLRDKDQYPSESILEGALGASYPAFSAFMAKIKEPGYKLNAEWRFYPDGKAWLCKITKSAKTVLWLSVWAGSFKTGFYFTEQSGGGIDELDIAEALKLDYRENKAIGKPKPLSLDISAEAQLPDLFTLISYKLARK